MPKKILLVGEPMGLLIAKELGELETVSEYSVAIAGAEYNVAVGMSRLGYCADYFTKLGSDTFGKRIAHDMEQNGIGTANIIWCADKDTGLMLKSKVTHGDPQVAYFRRGSAASTISVADVEAIDLDGYSMLHMTGILPALSSNCFAASRRLMERARAAGLFISFDPNLRPTLWPGRERMVEGINELAALVDLVLPGVSEGEILTGSRDPQKIAEFYLGRGAHTVVVKLGDKGAFAADADGCTTVEGFTVAKVVDTVGAGDGFAVGVISAIIEGRPIADALRRGNAIGAIQVASVGDNEGLPTRGQLAAFMGQADI